MTARVRFAPKTTGGRRRGSSRRPRRHSSRSAVLLLLALGMLFALAWGANQVEQAESLRTRLSRQRLHAQDEQLRLLAQWLDATRRETIVRRAQAELGMIEPAPEDKEVLALASRPEQKSPPAALRALARGLDRFGRIRGARAGEAMP